MEEHQEYPVDVLYCGVCSLPPDFCKYGPKGLKRCKPWLMKHVPDMYPNLDELSSEESVEANEEELEAEEQQKELVSIKILKRTKRKATTNVKGLGEFGIRLKPACKYLRGKFACGVSVGKGVDSDTIIIQGNKKLDIIQVIVEKYGEFISEDDFVFEEK
eukprot:TRINITY_DN5456_c0_g2_i1.p2 TRINITY_DN5456_c0_g2~~TRINITY_DN5456_c0_g2_i1.p2  ORF type:complete len:178 (+),score=49.64 TRINITY_DN5456_c0_g2_i1:57-536(+)